MAQLTNIRAIIEWKWGLEGENKKGENKDNKGGSEDGIVATTHHSRTNDLTTSKALQWAIK